MVLLKDGHFLAGVFVVVDLDALKFIIVKDRLIELLNKIPIPKLM